MTEYKAGDVVNGHVFTGTAWVPLNPMDAPPPAARKSGGCGRALLITALVVVVALVGLTVLGSYISKNTPKPSAGTTGGGAAGGQAADTRTSVTQSGQGKEVTARFDLEGDYSITWATTGDCTYYGDLEPGNRSIFEADTAYSGTNNIYGLPAGTYWVDVNTFAAPACPWTVTLTPQ